MTSQVYVCTSSLPLPVKDSHYGQQVNRVLQKLIKVQINYAISLNSADKFNQVSDEWSIQ